jgi:DnaJ homolog subfamily C member 28
LNAFRQILIQSWVRHVKRKLSTESPGTFSNDRYESAVLSRDRQWELRENSFHITALEEVNTLIRNYNNVAPYTVRKTYIDLQSELERAYRDSQQLIREEISSRRIAALNFITRGREEGPTSKTSAEATHTESESELKPSPGIWERFRRWFLALQRQN